MNLLIALCGRPGINRALVADNLADMFGGITLSLTQINRERGLTNGKPPRSEWRKTYIEVERRIGDFAANGGSVATIDWSNFHVGHRQRWADLAGRLHMNYLTLYLVPAAPTDGPAQSDTWADKLFESPRTDEPHVRLAVDASPEVLKRDLQTVLPEIRLSARPWPRS